MDDAAVLSEAERSFMEKTLHNNQVYRRLDGRSTLQMRPVRVEAATPTSNSRGSARVVAGCTEVICNVQLYMWKPEAGAPNDGLFDFIVSVDGMLAQGREHTDDTERDEATIGEQLRRQLMAAYKNSYNLQSLAIVPEHFCWKVVVLAYITCGDGNLLDLTSLCAYAALSQLTIPHCEIIKEEIDDGKFEYDVEIVEDVNTWHRLNMHLIPLVITVFYMADGNPPLLVDATRDEEAIADGCVIAAFLDDGSCTLIKNLVDVVVSEETFRIIMLVAEQLASKVFKEMLSGK